MALTLGQFVRSRRVLLGITQVDLAHAINRDQTYVSQLERDRIKHLPQPSFIRRLTAALHTTPEELFWSMGYLGEEITPEDSGTSERLARMLELTETLDLPVYYKELLRQDIRFLAERERLKDTWPDRDNPN